MVGRFGIPRCSSSGRTSIRMKMLKFTKRWGFSFPNLHKFGDILTFELPHDKTNKMACASSEDPDQPGHPPSLISLHCPHETYWAHCDVSDQTGWMPRLIWLQSFCWFCHEVAHFYYRDNRETYTILTSIEILVSVIIRVKIKTNNFNHKQTSFSNCVENSMVAGLKYSK